MGVARGGAVKWMRLLILGGLGMLGHKLWQTCQDRVDAWATTRGRAKGPPGLYPASRLLRGVDAGRPETVKAALRRVRPNVVVNAVGIVKQRTEAHDPVASLEVNALFPHRLHRLCQEAGARLIHVSTDCVFAGTKGGYRESDAPDAPDLYGRTKLLGEVQGNGAVTLRTSFIGRELGSSHGLVEWFLSKKGGSVPGYRRSFFSGLTSLELSQAILHVATRKDAMEGLYHVAGPRISKYELLDLIRNAYEVPVRIRPVAGPRIDRSLQGTRFRREAGFRASSWKRQVRDMAKDPTPYEAWRTHGQAA